MSTATTIEWTEATWNPVTGCSKVPGSEGCTNCYAATIAKRLWPTQYPPNPDGSPRRFEDVRLHPDRLDQPLRRRKPTTYFVNSMSDLFHVDVPMDFIASVFAVMSQTPRHTYQVLTKRPGRMASLVGRRDFIELVGSATDALYDDPDDQHIPDGPWPLPNVWLGVSVEDQAHADKRIPPLLETPAAVRFLSCEPLLGPIDLRHHLTGWCPEHDFEGGFCVQRDHSGVQHLGWVIVGGESGQGARPMHPEWARSLRDQCQAAGVPYFFKQWGAWAPDPPATGSGFSFVGKGAAGRELDGRTWDEMPERAH